MYTSYGIIFDCVISMKLGVAIFPTPVASQIARTQLVSEGNLKNHIVILYYFNMWDEGYKIEDLQYLKCVLRLSMYTGCLRSY